MLDAGREGAFDNGFPIGIELFIVEVAV